MLFALLLLVLLPFHWYAWRRLVQDPLRHRGFRIAGLAVLALLAGSLLVTYSRRVRDVLPDAIDVTASRAGHVWLGVLFYLVLVLVYVTNGAGFWGPPVRVAAPPDVTLVELGSP